VCIAVGVSRVYIGVHWPSDVLVGTVAGITTGFGAFWLLRWCSRLIKSAEYGKLLAVILLALSIFRIYYILTGPLALSPDEAQYWDWSRRLQLSYYSKPPMVAYIIRASTMLFGNNELGVRFPAVLLLALSSLFIYRLTYALALDSDAGISKEKASLAGFLAGALLQLVPMFAAFGIIMTIDSPLIFFWCVSLWLFWFAVKEPSMFKWLAVGLAVALGMLTKFTMVFFILSIFFYLTATSEKTVLNIFYLWLSLVVVIIFYMPVLVWNYSHDWVYFRHVLGHASAQKNSIISPVTFFEFVGSQLGLLTPLLALTMSVAVFKLRTVKNGNFLFWFALPAVSVFLLMSLRGKVQANWALPGYITGLIAMAIYVVFKWSDFKKWQKNYIVVAIILPVCVTAVAYYPSMLNLPPRLDPTLRLKGWRQLGAHVSYLRTRLKKNHFIFSDRYQITAELAFYVKGHPRTYCVALGRRMNQYDLWDEFYKLKGYDAIFVKRGNKPLPKAIINAFVQCSRKTFQPKYKNTPLRTYTIGICRGFKGLPKPVFTRF